MKPKGVIQMFKVIQNFIRKNSRGKLFFSAALFLLYSASPSPTEARWVDLSLWDEKVQTEQFLLEELNNPTKVESVKDNPDLLRIQREIVNANPGVLWFKGKNVHDYGLRPIQEVKRADQKGSSYNSGDGFIYVTHDDLLYMNGIYPYATRRKNDPWHVYNNSQIAFTIAHEIAHWKNPEKYFDKPLLGESRMITEVKNDHFGIKYHSGRSIDITGVYCTQEVTLAYMAARNYAKEHRIRIVNATRGGKLEVFQRMSLEKVLAPQPERPEQPKGASGKRPSDKKQKRRDR